VPLLVSSPGACYPVIGGDRTCWFGCGKQKVKKENVTYGRTEGTYRT
jgi:hypothetical protein